MSAAEITNYGYALLVDGMGMFLCWEYDADNPWPNGTNGAAYFDLPDLRQALRDLGSSLSQHTKVILMKL